MSTKMPTNISASVLARLANRSNSLKRPYNEILQYYAMERFLYRLSLSKYADKFILKGALMLRALGLPDARPTMDIDLKGILPNKKNLLIEFVKECMDVQCEDGITYIKTSITAEDITHDADYKGIRLTFKGKLGNARLNHQLDIGFGDVVTPEPKYMQYPELLDFGSPRILVYSPETSIAEKLQAMVERDMANSRMKDFYDIDELARHNDFNGIVLQQAIKATFAQRDTPVTEEVPLALSFEFANNPTKVVQWNAFVRKLGKNVPHDSLETAIKRIASFVLPVLKTIAQNKTFNEKWKAGGLWSNRGHSGH
jgi:predicted nucleotidyltransferase component of viral defense system